MNIKKGDIFMLQKSPDNIEHYGLFQYIEPTLNNKHVFLFITSFNGKANRKYLNKEKWALLPNDINLGQGKKVKKMIEVLFGVKI